MRPDLIYCGSCSLEFPLSDLATFIEHKRSKCSNSMFDEDCEYLQCFQCYRSFNTPWPLLYHVQTDHGIKVVRNLRVSSELPSKQTDDFSMQSFPYERDDLVYDDQVAVIDRPSTSASDVEFNKCSPSVDQSNNLTLFSTNASVSLTSHPSRNTNCRCQKNKNIEQGDNQSLDFRSVSYDSENCTPLNVALNLEESLRLIHRIACSKLDMHFRQMTSFNNPKSSSYALSFCCSRTSLSCLCTVDSCSCSSQPAPQAPALKSSTCQTDELSEPFIIDSFSTPSPFSLPDKSPINKSSILQDFSFLNCLTQPSTSVSPIDDPSLPPSLMIDSLPTDNQEQKPKLLPFTCSFCGRFYRQKIHLRKHVMAQHTKQKPFYCPHCAYSTVEKSHLKVHIRTHTGERPYTCRVCHYSSTQNCTLKSHYLRKHPESKLTCTACGGVYITELEYQNHLKNCTNLLDCLL
nr:zinc finger protein [Hymenolepis microstoma]